MGVFVLKIVAGAVVVGLIQWLSGTRHYCLAGLVPLFPTFALIAHYMVGSEHAASALKQTVLFGMLALVPYFVYLSALYVLIDRFRIGASLVGATLCWMLVATVLMVSWSRLS